MRNQRPVGEQVKSGLRIAGAVVGSIAMFAMFAGGYLRIVDPQRKQSSVAGWVLLAVAILALALTENLWSRWFCFIPGGMGLRGLIAISISLVLGGADGLPASNFWIAVCSLFLVMSLLTFRFQKRGQLSKLDRVSLLLSCVCFLVAVSRMVAQMNDAALLAVLGAGDLVLLQGWVYYQRKNWKQRRKRKATVRELWAHLKADQSAPVIQSLGISSQANEKWEQPSNGHRE